MALEQKRLGTTAYCQRLQLAHSRILPEFCYILAHEQVLRYLLTYLLIYDVSGW